MTQAVEIARKKLAELERDAEELRTFLRVHASLMGENAGESESSSDEASAGEGTASPAQIIDSSRVLMREMGHPLSRSKLVRLLTEKGLKLPGEDKAKNVGTVIWRSKKFDNIAGLGYWPKDFMGYVGQRPSPVEEIADLLS